MSPHAPLRGAQSILAANPEPAQRLFTTSSAAELAVPLGQPEFLVNGMLIKGTYGMAAGLMKTGKSYVAAAIMLGVASGEPVLGRFTVPGARLHRRGRQRPLQQAPSAHGGQR